MKVKPQKPNRNFTPVTIADSLKTVNKKFLSKFGKLDFIIHAKWGEIVGKFFVNHSEPLKITSIAMFTDELGSTIYEKYLHVNVSPASAIEFQHFQDKIIEKINSYFGYRAIHGIKIRQQFVKKDDFLNYNKKTNLIEREGDRKKVLESTPNLSNKKLEESIVNLGLSISKEEE